MKAALLAVVALLNACAHTPVVEVGSGQHSLTATAPSGGYDGSREGAVEQAHAYCARQGLAAVTDGFYDKSELGPQGEHTSTVLFRCAPPKALVF